MKVRVGFVSNSSTCSFLIHGMYLEEITEGQWKLIDESIKAQGFKYDEIEVTTGASDWWGSKGHLYVGIDYKHMKDEETKAEFKARAQAVCDKIMDDLGLPHEECSTHEEAWRDG